VQTVARVQEQLNASQKDHTASLNRLQKLFSEAVCADRALLLHFSEGEREKESERVAEARERESEREREAWKRERVAWERERESERQAREPPPPGRAPIPSKVAGAATTGKADRTPVMSLKGGGGGEGEGEGEGEGGRVEDPSALTGGNSSYRTPILMRNSPSAVWENYASQLPRDTGVVMGRLEEAQPRRDELVALACLMDDEDWARTLLARSSACMVMQAQLLAGDSLPHSQPHTWLSRSSRSHGEKSPLGSPARQPAASKNGGTHGTTRTSLLFSHRI